MPLFARNKETAVQSFVTAFLNQNCPALRDRSDGPRIEGRVNLTKVVMIVPVEKKRALLRQAFPAITKEFSSLGVAIVVDRPRSLDEVLLGFRWRGNIIWIWAKAKHMQPMGGGFFQIGFRMTERLQAADQTELASLVF